MDSQGISLSADHSWSLVGRLGFDLVKHLDPKLDSKCYFKASLLHEFLDGDDVTAAYGTDRYITTNDQKEPGALSALATASRPEINSPCTLIWNATLVMTFIAPTACELDSIGSSDHFLTRNLSEVFSLTFRGKASFCLEKSTVV